MISAKEKITIMILVTVILSICGAFLGADPFLVFVFAVLGCLISEAFFPVKEEKDNA